MNKQQFATKIWESANKMRSKIEANEYKDYILGFIFYKYLSDKEERRLKQDGWRKKDICLGQCGVNVLIQWSASLEQTRR